MRHVTGNGGFRIQIDDDGHVKLDDPRICEALEAAVKDSGGGAIALWFDHEFQTFRAAEIYGSIPADLPVGTLGMQQLLDNQTSTWGTGRSLVEALRWMLGSFWIKVEDMP